MEDEGKVPVEGVGQVGASQLARVGIRAKDVGGAAVRPILLADFSGWGVSDQLQQRDPTVLWGQRGNRTSANGAQEVRGRLAAGGGRERRDEGLQAGGSVTG